MASTASTDAASAKKDSPIINTKDPNRWFTYYENNFTPWDSRTPSSQILKYLFSPCDQLPAPTFQGDGFAGLDKWSVNLAHPDYDKIHSGDRGSGKLKPLAFVANLLGKDGSGGERGAERSGKEETGIVWQGGEKKVMNIHRCEKCRQWKPPPKAKVLELACGTASTSLFLATIGFSVAAMDLVPTPIRSARALAREHLGLTIDTCALLAADLFEAPADMGFRWAQKMAREQEEDDEKERQSRSSESRSRKGSRSRLRLGTLLGADGEAPSKEEKERLDSGSVQSADGLQASGNDAGDYEDDRYDLCYDCQCWHVLRRDNEEALVSIYERMVKPGGFLFIIAGRAPKDVSSDATISATKPGPAVSLMAAAEAIRSGKVPATSGPPKVTEKDIRKAFKEDKWQVGWIAETELDRTEHYESQGVPFPGWWVLLRRRKD
ncbi:hypothetical protein HK102_006259 [Quaeritorhiza haematococci]|nr:hypothetical protein HK102_006259 [Quaeritorhiza haematococci]